jgi:cell division protease FtsH
MNPTGHNKKDRKTPFNMSRGLQSPFLRILLILVLVSLVTTWIGSLLFGGRANMISYTSFKSYLEAGNVKEVLITGNRIVGLLKVSQAPARQEGGQPGRQFVTYVPSFGDEELLSLLDEQGVVVNVQPESNFSILGLLINLLPFLILGWIFYSYYRNMQRQGGGIFGMGKSRAKLYKRSREKTTFSDVAGIRSVKEELKEIIDYLKSPERFRKLGAKTPKGALLVGPPGTGKTLLARAVAGEANVPFYSITGSDFMEMFVGVGASRVRNLFDDAKKHAPSIIFIDELDSIGRHRGAGLGGGHDEREQTLNQLLAEMDGFEPNEGTIVMAATNRPDILDPALLRPGRFDRRITVDMPTLRDRIEILKIHSRHKTLADDVDLEEIARGTPGFSGADLENLMNEAALLTARKEKEQTGREEVEEARDKVIMGLERSNLSLTDEEKKAISYHEAGHALVAATLPHTDPIHKVTIIPRGRAMGVTQQLPERDKYLYNRDYMLDRIAVMLGGRASETLVLGTTTSGAENDLKEATRLARKMVLDWGMSDRMGNIAFGSTRSHVFLGEEIGKPREYSESTAREIDGEIKELLRMAYERAKSVLEERKKPLESIAQALLEREELGGKEILTLIREKGGVTS